MAGSEPSALGRPQGFIIRQYRKADQEALAALFYQIQREEFPWVDGFCSVWEPDSFVHNLFVAKGCRRAGVGSALLERAAQEFPLPLALKCVAENRSALGFYLSHGWKIQQEGYSPDGPYYWMAFDGKG